jgi:hypothetical protein
MHKDDCRAALQLVEQGSESRVAEIDAACVGEQDNPVRLENEEAVSQFAQGTADVGQRQCRIDTWKLLFGDLSSCLRTKFTVSPMWPSNDINFLSARRRRTMVCAAYSAPACFGVSEATVAELLPLKSPLDRL